MSESERSVERHGGGGGRWNVWVGAALLVGAAALTGYLAAADAGAPDDPEAMTDSARSVRQAREACGSRRDGKKLACYQAAFSQRLRSDGVAAAMTTLEGLYPLDEDVERDAHVYAHHIGIEAYSLASSVAEAFSGCSDMFSSGCYHGVIQAYFEDVGTVDSASVNGLCQPYKGDGRSRWILFQCLHGMGHGLTMHHGHDLPRALESCDLLGHNWDRQSCYGGAFMENVMAVIAPHHPATVLATEEPPAAVGGTQTGDAAHPHGGGAMADPAPRDPNGLYAPGSSFKALDPDDPHYPCSVVEERHLHACYLMQTSAMLHMNGVDIGDAAESCRDAPSTFRFTCYQSLGRDITANARQDPDEVLDQCGEVDEGTDRTACYVGAVKALVDWRSEPAPGVEFCRRVEGEKYESACYEALGEEVATLLADVGERIAVCDEVEPAHADVCLRGARVPSRAREARAAS